MGGMRTEIERVEASNKPLPLPEGEGIKEDPEATGDEAGAGPL